MNFKLIVPFLFLSINAAAQSHVSPLLISKLTDNFYIYTTHRNYQGTPFPANGMYLITREGAVLFDSPWDTTQFQPLIDSIKARHNKDVVMCIATHSHSDRTAGLEFYASKGARTYTSARTDAFSKKTGEKRAQFLFKNDTTISVGEYSFLAYYGGPGHTEDNIVIWFPTDKVLYGGCLIKSTEAKDLGNLADANPAKWPATINKIKRKFGQPAYVVPGHQDWTNNKSLDHTLELLRQYSRKAP